MPASARRRPSPEGAAPKSSGSRTGEDSRPPVVLLVDDVEDNRDLYETIFVHDGFEVVSAKNGEEAVAFAREHRPDVIIMDLSMPVLDGWEATRRIRTDVGLAATYIIAVSGFADARSRKRAIESGCDEFLPKPCLPRDLVARVRSALRGDD